MLEIQRNWRRYVGSFVNNRKKQGAAKIHKKYIFKRIKTQVYTLFTECIQFANILLLTCPMPKIYDE